MRPKQIVLNSAMLRWGAEFCDAALVVDSEICRHPMIDTVGRRILLHLPELLLLRRAARSKWVSIFFCFSFCLLYEWHRGRRL